jgi:tetratricopeptide (TPR) repeat protein
MDQFIARWREQRAAGLEIRLGNNAWRNLSVSLSKRGHLEESVQAAQDAVHQYPESEFSHQTFLGATQNSKDWDLLRQECERWFEQHPDDVGTWARLSLSYVHPSLAPAMQDPELGLEAAETAMQLSEGNSTEALHSLGHALALNERFYEAIDHTQKLIRLVPENEHYRTDLLYYQRATGVVEIAREGLNSWLQRHPEDTQLWNELAWSYVDPAVDSAKQDPEQGLEAAEIALELSESKDPAILDTYAHALFLNDRIDEAIDAETQAINLAPEGSSDKALFQQTLTRFRNALKNQAPKTPTPTPRKN